MYKYDYLIVGAGLFGSVFAHEACKKGKRCLVVDKRSHIGGNCYTEKKDKIHIHKYGPHIFHTNNKKIWRYVNDLVKFNHFEYKPKVFFEGKYYSFPLNMMTFHQLWGCQSVNEAKAEIENRRHKIENPKNLEEWFLSQVGTELYEIFFKGYSEKQWGRPLKEMPCSIGKRLPIRFTFNENYYNDKFQGIPKGGYTKIFHKLLRHVDLMLESDYFNNIDFFSKIAKQTIYTGCIDEYFNYSHGKLDYRTLSFYTDKYMGKYFLGNVAINYTSTKQKHTRQIEHKFFDWKDDDISYITTEYPSEHTKDTIPFYPINNRQNNEKYEKYLELSKKYKNIYFCGRMGEYKYLNMDEVIIKALDLAKRIL